LKLDPGNYIVKIRGVHFGSTHILRVFWEGRTKYFQFDSSYPYKVSRDDEPWELERFKILERLERKIEYTGREIEVSFADKVSGHCFSMKTKNKAAFKRVLTEFPRFWKGFE